MKCPQCEHVDLTMSERQGVEIDYCPKCRGVWLDRGEPDKIIDRAEDQRGVSSRDSGNQKRGSIAMIDRTGHTKDEHRSLERFSISIERFDKYRQTKT